MSTENGVRLQVDQQKRICVSDVINMLKGLRSEAVINIVRISDAKGKADTLTSEMMMEKMAVNIPHIHLISRLQLKVKQNCLKFVNLTKLQLS